nr:MAG TPA: hypothetical protein [Caudoviricetes sp.]
MDIKISARVVFPVGPLVPVITIHSPCFILLNNLFAFLSPSNSMINFSTLYGVFVYVKSNPAKLFININHAYHYRDKLFPFLLFKPIIIDIIKTINA